jgi:outer membrane protein assembly factor BamB
VYSSPAVVDGVVYFGSNDRSVYAIDASSGQKVWSYKTGDAIDGSAAIAGGAVYIGSKDHNIYALNAKTGDLIWSYKTGGDIESFASIANGVLYIGSNDYYVYAIGEYGSQQTLPSAATISPTATANLSPTTSPSSTALPLPTTPEFPPWTAVLLGVIASIPLVAVFKRKQTSK